MDAAAAKPAPGVLGWYRAYAAAMALLYLLVAGLAIVAMVARHRLADAETPPAVLLVFALLTLLLSLGLLAAFVAALLLPPRPWVWIYHLVLITVGMTSACCLPACIALLVFWIKPEARAHFGRD